MSIGDSISRLRKLSGMTQKQLADVLFVSADLVSKWECGSRRPDHKMIISLAELFGVDPCEIIDTENMMMTELKRCIPGNVSPDRLTDLFNAFLGTLPERESDIFVLRYYYFRDIKSIADMTKLTGANVRMILSRTRTGFRKFLEKGEYR